MSGLFHVNEYSLNRAYGGSEEGGWWYDFGRFIKCHGTYSTREDAVAALTAVRSTVNAARRGRHSPGSPLCTGPHELQILTCRRFRPHAWPRRWAW